MVLPSRLGCPLSLKTPNMGNTGQNPPSFDPYMGYVFFNESGQGTSRNCLGDLYRARSLGEDRVKCDANGNTVLE